MHHTRAAQSGAPPHDHRILNHLVTVLLRSPLHGLVSRDLLLITFTGRKSGRSFTTPVTYIQDSELITFHSTQRWWKNLEGGAPVTLQLCGRMRTGWAVPTQDVSTIVEAIETLLARKGLHRADRIDLTLAEPSQLPTRAELEAAAQQRVLVTVTLDSASAATH